MGKRPTPTTMRSITAHELRQLEETLDWIRPIINVDYVYDEAQNLCLIGDNYLISGFTSKQNDVETDYFKLIYGSDHPGDDHWNLDRWEEEDIARATSVAPLLPVMVASMFRREMETRIYSTIKLGKQEI